MRKIIIIIISLLIWLPMHGQTEKDITRLIDKGDANVNKGKYIEAIADFNEALEMSRKIYDERSLPVVACKSYLADAYFCIHDYQLALSLFENVASFQMENEGEDSYEYAVQLSHIAECYSALNHFSSAVEYNEKALQIQQNFFSDDRQDYLFTLNELINDCSSCGDYDKAAKYGELLLSGILKVSEKESEAYISSANKLSNTYCDAERYQDVIHLCESILPIVKSMYGDNSAQYAAALSPYIKALSNSGDDDNAATKCIVALTIANTSKDIDIDDRISVMETAADFYDHIGKYRESIEYRKLAIADKEKAGDYSIVDVALSYRNLSISYQKERNLSTSLEYANKSAELLLNSGVSDFCYACALSQQSSVLSAIGDRETAIQKSLEALNIYSEEVGEEHSYFIGETNSLAVNYQEVGNYELAIRYGKKSLELAAKLYGTQSGEYLTYLSNMAASYAQSGDYVEGLRCAKEALTIAEQTKEISDEELGYIYAHLANSYEDIGDYDSYYPCLEKSLSCFKKERYPREYATTLDNIALYYQNIGDGQKALEYALSSAEMRKELFGKDSADYAYSLNNLAYIYSNSFNDKSKALEMDAEAAEIRRGIFGEMSLDYLSSLNNLSVDYSVLHEYATAIMLDLKALEIAEEILAPTHPDYIHALYNIANDYYQNQQYDFSIPYISRFVESESRAGINSLKGLTTGHKVSYLDKTGHRMERALHWCLELGDDARMSTAAYNSILFTKGALLSSSSEFERIINSSNDRRVKSKAEEYRALKMKVGSSYDLSDNISPQQLDSLRIKSELLEMELLSMSEELRNYVSVLESTSDSVKKALKENEVAVEFYLDDYYDKNIYYSLVIRKDWEAPKVIPLCYKSFVDILLNDGPESYEQGFSELYYSAFWKPIEEYVNDGDVVYFSPDAGLNQVNLEVFGLREGGRITNNCKMVRLSSTRNICVADETRPIDNAAIYGGLRYDVDSKRLVELHAKYNTPASSHKRGIDFGDGERRGWSYLPFTAEEVALIKQQLDRHSVNSYVYTEDLGTEESFKSLSGQNVSIIHIATHGFFINQSSTKPLAYLRGRGDTIVSTEVDPMLRSGLIMSGGQNAWLGGTVPNDIEDGILLSQEIAEMDLSNVDVVVLSACETGLGDIKGDGVFGLQRAFKKAGARSIIMSLWTVDDSAAKHMMAEFYSNLSDGKDVRSAFAEAQKSVRDKYVDPYYWASFILLD